MIHAASNFDCIKFDYKLENEYVNCYYLHIICKYRKFMFTISVVSAVNPDRFVFDLIHL